MEAGGFDVRVTMAARPAGEPGLRHSQLAEPADGEGGIVAALSGMRKLKSKPPDGEGMRKRVEDALRKREFGEMLSQKERMIVQWVRHGGGCSACSSVEVAVGFGRR